MLLVVLQLHACVLGSLHVSLGFASEKADYVRKLSIAPFELLSSRGVEQAEGLNAILPQIWSAETTLRHRVWGRTL